MYIIRGLGLCLFKGPTSVDVAWCLTLPVAQLMPASHKPPSAGARVLIRDEEWIVQRSESWQQGGWQLTCIGVSETVRHRVALLYVAVAAH